MQGKIATCTRPYERFKGLGCILSKGGLVRKIQTIRQRNPLFLMQSLLEDDNKNIFERARLQLLIHDTKKGDWKMLPYFYFCLFLSIVVPVISGRDRMSAALTRKAQTGLEFGSF